MAFWNLPEGEPGRRRIERKGESDGLGQKYDGKENIKGERKRIEPRSPPPPLAASRRDNQKKRLRPLSDIVRRVLRLKLWPDETHVPRLPKRNSLCANWGKQIEFSSEILDVQIEAANPLVFKILLMLLVIYLM